MPSRDDENRGLMNPTTQYRIEINNIHGSMIYNEFPDGFQWLHIYGVQKKSFSETYRLYDP